MRGTQLAAAAAAAALVLGNSSLALAQSGANERMPGGVERSQDQPGGGAASDSVKPSTAPRMGTTRGLTAPVKPPAAAAPPAPVPTAPVTTPAPTTRGVDKKGSASESAAPPSPAPPPPGSGKGYDERLPGGVERAPGSAR